MLTPNSHTSSTHSLTPQHQIQHQVNLLPPIKCEDHEQLKPNQHQNPVASSEGMHQQQPNQNMSASSMNQEMLTESTNSATATAYSFMDDELAAAANMRINSPLNKLRPPPTDSVYMGMSEITDAEEQCSTVAVGAMPDEAVSLNQQQQRQELQLQPTPMTTCQKQQRPEEFNSNNNNLASYVRTDHQQEHELKDGLLSKPPQKRRGRKKKIITTDNFPIDIPK